MTNAYAVFLPTNDPLAAEQHAIEALGDIVAATTTHYSPHDAHRLAHEFSAAGTRTANRDLVADALIGGRHARDLLASISGHLDEGQQMAGRILAELPGHLSSDPGYEANLAAILAAGSVGPKHLDLAVSAVNAWNRLVGRQVADEVRGHRRDNLTHAGTVGEPTTLTGTVITATRAPGYHHRSSDQALLVIDCGTAIAKTITSAAWAYQVERGDQMTITAMVKAHNEYHGVPQTVLSRPKRIDDPTPAARTEQVADPTPGTLCDAAWEVVNATQAGPRPFPGRPTHWPKRHKTAPSTSRPTHPTTGKAHHDD